MPAPAIAEDGHDSSSLRDEPGPDGRDASDEVAGRRRAEKEAVGKDKVTRHGDGIGIRHADKNEHEHGAMPGVGSGEREGGTAERSGTTHRKASSISPSPSSKLCVIYEFRSEGGQDEDPRPRWPVSSVYSSRAPGRRGRDAPRTRLIPMPSTTVSTWCRRLVPSRSFRSNMTPYLTLARGETKSG